jgi:hypothetical protein
VSSQPKLQLVESENRWAEQWQRERVEDYLEHVSAPLVGIVPYAERQGLRREVEDHLWQLIGEFQTTGLAVEASTDEALREHGEPWSIGRRFLDEWCQRAPHRRVACRVSADTLRGFAWFGIATVPTLLMMEAHALLLNDTQRSQLAPFLTLLAVLAPFIAGGLTGLTVRIRAATAVARALQALTIMTVGAGLLILPQTEVLYFALFQLLFWLPAGCVSASLAANFALCWRRERFFRFGRSVTT